MIALGPYGLDERVDHIGVGVVSRTTLLENARQGFDIDHMLNERLIVIQGDRLSVTIFLRPSAAGQVFHFNFPGSAISLTAVPEPSSAFLAATATAALTGLACAGRWRSARRGTA